MRETDGEIVAAVLGGATEGFAKLVERHDRRVRAIVAERVRDAAAREEVVHQTFYLAFRHLAQLADPARFEGWLASIAARCAGDHARESAARRARHTALDGSETRADADDSRAWVWEEVARLSPAHREVLVLRYRLRSSYREIAARLGVPLSTVRGRIHEARRALRARLATDRDAGDDR